MPTLLLAAGAGASFKVTRGSFDINLTFVFDVKLSGECDAAELGWVHEKGGFFLRLTSAKCTLLIGLPAARPLLHRMTTLPRISPCTAPLLRTFLYSQSYETVSRIRLLTGEMSASNGRALSFSRLLIVTFILVVFYLLGHASLPDGYTLAIQTPSNLALTQNTLSEDKLHDNDPAHAKQESCIDAPGADNVLVMLKTGATELYQKLPAHLVTTFKCVPHFMIFSDLAQEMADYRVYDAIASVSQPFREDHLDFELYRKLHQYQRESQDMGNLQGDDSWNLDKWKFLPMMHQAFTQAGDNIEWFIIIEADTSLSWTNLLQWLATMNPRKSIYAGAQNLIGDTHFAHGGSGIVISRRAADLLEEAREEEGTQSFDERWEQLTSESCCGDEVIARAFLEIDVPLTHAWPLIQGETVSSLDWTSRHWCSTPVSWHHVTSIEVDALWQFERRWVREHGWDVPYLYRDVFSYFIERHVSVNRTKWNNLSQDHQFVSASLATDDDPEFLFLEEYERKATESEGHCVEACLKMPEDECIQWMYSSGRCYLGKVIRFGQSDEHEWNHWTSGWIQERVEKFKKKHEDCEVRWSG